MIDEYRQMRAFWAEVIDQCISSKPVNDNAAALLDYLKRSEFTVEQLHAIILGALTEDESNDEGEQDEDDEEDTEDENDYEDDEEIDYEDGDDLNLIYPDECLHEEGMSVDRETGLITCMACGEDVERLDWCKDCQSYTDVRVDTQGKRHCVTCGREIEENE